MPSSSIFIAVFFVLVFWALGAHNRLERLRGKALAAWRSLYQRLDESGQSLLDQLHQSPVRGEPNEPNQTNVNPGLNDLFTASSNAPAWDNLRQAAKQHLSSLRTNSLMQKRLVEADNIASIATSYRVLLHSWASLQQVQDDLGGAAIPPELLIHWQINSAACAQQIKLYNAATQNYQQAIEQFPALILAWLFGFERSAALSLPEDQINV